MARCLAGVLLLLLTGCAALQPSPPPSDPWPLEGAVMRPDVMFVDPTDAQPGEIVNVIFRPGWDRGVLYAIDAKAEDQWERRFMLISDAGAPRPLWFLPGDDDVAVESLGIGGQGPDRLRIPEVTEPGDYRICTANAAEDICVPVHIVAP